MARLGRQRYRVFLVCHPEQRGMLVRLLEENGCEVELGRTVREGAKYDEGELASIAGRCDALLISSWERISSRVLEAGRERLLTVAKFGIGLDNVDLRAATRLGILVSNTPIPEDYVAVAEGTMARILALAKRLKSCEASLRRGEWKNVLSTYMKGKTIGIIGLGRVGSRVAKLLQPWGVRLLVYDPYIPKEKAELMNAELVSLEELLASSDIVTIHCTLTDETKGMIGEGELRRMKPQAYLINTARGPIVDERALVRALKENWIAGAALDVFEEEPLAKDSPLLDDDLEERLILSPHVAAATPEARERMALQQAENCIRALKGEVPEYVGNPEVLPKWRERWASLKVG